MQKYVYVSLIITTWNNKAKLRGCLESIFEHSSGADLEIIIVDNNSNDGTIEMVNAEFPQVLLIENKSTVSAAHAINQGIEKSKGNYIIHLDDDIKIIENNWVNYLIDVANSNDKIGLVGCKLVYPDGKIQHAGGFIGPLTIGHYGHKEEDKGQYNLARKVDYLCGAVLLMKKDLIDEIGMWDEEFYPVYADDAEYCLRAKTNGYKVMYSPKPTVIHYQATATKKNKGNIHMIRNIWKLKLIYFPKGWLITSLLLGVPKELISGLLRKNVNAYITAYSQIIRNNQTILCKRKALSNRKKIV